MLKKHQETPCLHVNGCFASVLKAMDLKMQLIQEGFIVQTVKQRSVTMLIEAPLLKYLKLVILTNRLAK